MRTHHLRARRTLAILASALVSGALVAAQPAPLAGLDDFVATGMKAWRIPGFAAAVVKDGNVVFARGSGVRELGKPDPVDTRTLFAIGSTTKAMTAALIGMLVDEKKLEWDDPVVKHLPWFQLKDPAVTRELTVRDLLTHRGGLGGADFLWYGQANSAQEILRRVRLIEPGYPVRSRFVYQNVMYAAAGAVIEAVSGRSWAQMIESRIFEPLQMRDTVATAAGLSKLANVASPHYVIAGQVRVIENASVDPVAPAGAVWSSIADMAKWTQCLLAGGRGPDGKALLSETTVAELFSPQAIASEGYYPTSRLTKPHWMTYGLGWFQQDYQGRAVDFHTGSIDGMVAIHGLIRDERLGVLVLSNLDHAEFRHALMLSVFDRYAGKSDRDWGRDVLSLYEGLQRNAEAERQKREAARVTGTSASRPLKDYAGDYGDPLYGDVEVRLEDGTLRLRYGPGFVGTLEHWHYNTFRARWAAEWRSPSLVNFVLDSSGRVGALELVGGRFSRKPEPSASRSPQ
jgi:CubicO group peptidase (beta-lactamase class C family)